MNILVLNSGSSSIKFQFIQMPSEVLVCSGVVERIGEKDAIINYKTKHTAIQETTNINTYNDGLQKMVDLLRDHKNGVIQDTNEIDVVGHRVVHGGNSFSDTAIITPEVKQEIKNFSSLAPLHNPNNLEGILVAEQLFPQAVQVAVFDTAFHQTIPQKAKQYAIPKHLTNEHGIQLYGFHGTSHKYVTEKAIEYLGLATSKIISVHLGNGCSITASKNGKSVDHSLGFSPSNGLIMGTRSGDIDHAIIFYLVENLGYSLTEVNNLLTKKSGMLGLTGYSDLRDIQAKAEEGDADCKLALAMNAYRIKKYIGAYTAALNGLDALIFTAGIGENSSLIRQMVCDDMEVFGIKLDTNRNQTKSATLREINCNSSKVKILVIPTNEELEIAKQAFRLVKTS